MTGDAEAGAEDPGSGAWCLDASPAARAVVRDDGSKYLKQRGPVDRVAPVDLQGPRRRVAVSLVDDAVRVEGWTKVILHPGKNV